MQTRPQNSYYGMIIQFSQPAISSYMANQLQTWLASTYCMKTFFFKYGLPLILSFSVEGSGKLWKEIVAGQIINLHDNFFQIYKFYIKVSLLHYCLS